MLKISTVILSYNRLNLLKKTVESYLGTVSVPYELIIVDNASSDGCKNFIQDICKKNHSVSSIFLTENMGGEGFNEGLSLAQAPYLHTSENDLEYLPGWDTDLLSKFNVFPKLGQLSLFSHEPQSDKGEIREPQKFSKIEKKENKTIFLTDSNIATPSIFRREIFDKGARWKTRKTTDESYQFPADYQFSQSVIKLGYWVAWNDKYTVLNWGYNIQEWIENPDYYVGNYIAKSRIGLKGMKERLGNNGYDLIEENGKYRIKKIE